VEVIVDPPVGLTTEVSGDGKFLVLTPQSPLVAATDGTVEFTLTAPFLINPQRAGLKLSGGSPGGTASLNFSATLNPPSQASYALPIPGGTWQVSRLAFPLPTLLPSYNEIGFDSLLYLVGLVEGTQSQAVAWMVGATIASDGVTTVVDPTTQALIPLDVSYLGGFITFSNQAGVSVVVMNAQIPFRTFRMAAALGTDGNASGPLRINGDTVCAQIPRYGVFLQLLGLCNAQTDLLSVVGAANFGLFQTGTVPPPTGVGTVAFTISANSVMATLTGTMLKAAEHVASILLVDAVAGTAVSLDYGPTTVTTADAQGLLSTVTVPFDCETVPSLVRAYLMIDTTPVASTALTVP
jgi:hypothetical protein